MMLILSLYGHISLFSACRNNMLAMGGGSGGGQMRRGGFSGGRSRGGMW